MKRKPKDGKGFWAKQNKKPQPNVVLNCKYAIINTGGGKKKKNTLFSLPKQVLSV